MKYLLLALVLFVSSASAHKAPPVELIAASCERTTEELTLDLLFAKQHGVSKERIIAGAQIPKNFDKSTFVALVEAVYSGKSRVEMSREMSAIARECVRWNVNELSPKA
jgi:hypothetical protein